MLLATKLGEIKKTALAEFEWVRRAGLIAMDLEPGDELVFARLAHDEDDVMMVTAQGKAIRFAATELRSASRASGGVRGIRLATSEDEVVGLEIVVPDAMLLTISETGLGKRTDFDEYPRHSRGGQGVVTHTVTGRTGRVVSARAVTPMMEVMLISQSGIIMRTTVESIAKVGRAAQGVHVQGLSPGDRVASVAVIDMTKPPPPVGGNGASPNGRPGRQTRGSGRRSRRG